VSAARHAFRLFISAAVLIACGSLCAPSAVAVTCTSAASAAWNVATTWSGCAGGNGTPANTPGASDTAIIANGNAVTIPAGLAASASSLQVGNLGNGAATLTLSASTSSLAVSGAVSVDRANNNNVDALNVNAGTVSMGSLTMDNSTNTSRLVQLNISTGTASVTGDVTFTNANAQVQIVFSGAGTLNVGGNLPTAAITFTPSTGTVNYNGTGAQTIATYAYNNLSVTKSSGTATLAANTSVGGDLTVTCPATCTNGTLDLSTFTADRAAAGGTITVGAGALLRIAGTNTFPANYSTVSLDPASTVEYNGTVQTISAQNYGNLTISGARGANSVTLASSGTIGIAGAFSPTATFSTGGYVITGSTVAYNGSSPQTMGAFTYNGLTISNSSGVTLTASPTVNGTLTFTSGTLTTGSNKVTVGASGGSSGAGTSKHVVGNLEKVYTAAGSFTYAVGDGTNYTPITLNFTTLTTTGNLTVSVTNSAHPNTTAATDGIDVSKDINRYWTVKNPTLAGTYTATSTYINGTPVDRASAVTVSGVNLPNVIVRKGSSCSGSGGSRTCSAWAGTTLSGTPTTTQATASGISVASGAAESDLAIGEPLSSNFARERQFIYTREQY
jgi:hypothetical protein